MTTQTYFVTGGCGFLGQYTVRALHDHDPAAQIRVLDLAPRRTLLNIEELPRVSLLNGDLTRPETFAAELRGVDTVVHTAGRIYYRTGGGEALRLGNLTGTLNLLAAALDHGCRTFIFISSISAVGCRPGYLSDERMVPDLAAKWHDDPYGYSKLAGERALQARAGAIRAIILNPSVILGPGSPRIAKVLRSLRWLPACPMTTTFNSFVDVRDVARAVVLALSRGRSGERYIVTAHNVDNLSFMRLVLPLMGKQAPAFAVSPGLLRLYDGCVRLLDALHLNPALRPSASFTVDKAYSAAKIRRELGWRPRYSLEQSLRDTVRPHVEEERYGPAGQERAAYRRV